MKFHEMENCGHTGPNLPKRSEWESMGFKVPDDLCAEPAKKLGIGQPAQHTPGPWNAVVSRTGILRVVDDQNGVNMRDICEVTRNFDGRNNNARQAEAKANARLIAAAPELLQALREIVAVPNRYDVCPRIASEMYEIARAAIAKAERGEG